MNWFRPLTGPGGYVKGVVVPDETELDGVCKQLEKEGVGALATMLRDTFRDHPSGAHIFNDARLELIRVLALKAPCSHLAKPHIQDDLKVRLRAFPWKHDSVVVSRIFGQPLIWVKCLI